MSRPVLCLDFDGVIHSYESGWRGADVIPDPPVPGAVEFVKAAMGCFTVVIHSSRFNSAARRGSALIAVGAWLLGHGINSLCVGSEGWPEGGPDRADVVYLSAAKPPALVTLDDRAVTFTGTFPDPQSLLGFRPWNKAGQV